MTADERLAETDIGIDGNPVKQLFFGHRNLLYTGGGADCQKIFNHNIP
jgi:hypothetical protein